MKIRVFTFAANNREVISVTDDCGNLLIPTEVPVGAIELFRRRLRDRINRPLAWRRREARGGLAELAKLHHGRLRVQRHVPVRSSLRRRRTASRGVVLRRQALPPWIPPMR